MGQVRFDLGYGLRCHVPKPCSQPWSGATGTILAAFGTARPESVVALVAAAFGSTSVVFRQWSFRARAYAAWLYAVFAAFLLMI
jgi:hypothetical protein